MQFLGTEFPAKFRQENLSHADGFLLIVTPHETEKQLHEIGGQLDGMATQFSHKKMVVLVNKLYVPPVV
jgi:hypothetical protein